MTLDGDAKRNEVNWARNHALAWAEKNGLEDDEADGFAEYFKDGWLSHLEKNADQVDRDLRTVYNTYRKEKASGG